MLAADDNGHVLDAEYSVEADRGELALILESAGGATGGRSARNSGYRRALAVLLSRLRDLDCVIGDALVDSGFTQRHGIEAARLRLTSAQARIGHAPGVSKGGNSSKRIRLRLEVPGYGAGEAHRLAADLAPPAHLRGSWPGLVAADGQSRAAAMPGVLGK